MSRWEFWNRGRAHRVHAKPPPRAQRTWVHPSELPSFESIDVSPVWQLKSRTARVTGVVMAIALIIGAIGLSSTNNPSSAGSAMPARIARTLGALPANSRVAAERTVDLTITTPANVSVVAAMVLPHDLAVTTTWIPRDAKISGSTTGHVNFGVKWIGRDTVMGFSIVRLGVHITPLDFAPLPASASVVAVSPMLTSAKSAPQYAWADTTLGDPTVVANGVISYLSTKTDADINHFVDGVAVNQAGLVVAVLSSNHLWYSAQFVARVAEIVATGRGCHSSLGIIGTTAQGGGVMVERVVPKSPAQSKVQRGDIITTFNGMATDTFAALGTELYLTPAYSSAQVTFVRKTTVHHGVMTLGCAL